MGGDGGEPGGAGGKKRWNRAGIFSGISLSFFKRKKGRNIVVSEKIGA